MRSCGLACSASSPASEPADSPSQNHQIVIANGPSAERGWRAGGGRLSAPTGLIERRGPVEDVGSRRRGDRDRRVEVGEVEEGQLATRLLQAENHRNGGVGDVNGGPVGRIRLRKRERGLALTVTIPALAKPVSPPWVNAFTRVDKTHRWERSAIAELDVDLTYLPFNSAYSQAGT